MPVMLIVEIGVLLGVLGLLFVLGRTVMRRAGSFLEHYEGVAACLGFAVFMCFVGLGETGFRDPTLAYVLSGLSVAAGIVLFIVEVLRQQRSERERLEGQVEYLERELAQERDATT